MNLDMQTISNKSSSSANYINLFLCYENTKLQINYFLIQYLFKFCTTVFKMPLDSGRFPRKHAKYTVVLEKYSWLSADFFLFDIICFKDVKFWVEQSVLH